MEKQSYFCSYTVFNNSVVSGYGDLIFEGVVGDNNKLLGDIKNHLIETFYNGDESVRIVVTSLNRV